MAKAHYNLGMLFRLKGEKVRASSFLHDALRHNPDNPLYRLGLGMLQYEMGNKIEGSANLDKVRAQMERMDLAALALAYQMYINQRYQPAEKAAARAYKENGELSEAYLLRGKALLELNQEEEAKEMFKKALELDKNVLEAKAALEKIEAKEEAARLEAEAKAKAEAAVGSEGGNESGGETSDSVGAEADGDEGAGNAPEGTTSGEGSEAADSDNQNLGGSEVKGAGQNPEGADAEENSGVSAAPVGEN
jgi:tetratricopeptide (TPR) repeat protein